MFESIEDLKGLEGDIITDTNIPYFVKGIGKLLNIYVDYNKFMNGIEKYGGYTIYDKEDKPIRIVASLEEQEKFSFIRINQINTNDDMYIVFYNHSLEDGYPKNNVELVMDEHTLNGRKIVDWNISDDSVEEIFKTKQYEYDGVVYKVREISQ